MTATPPIVETGGVVEARGLRKSFGKTEILRGLSFTIPAGRIYGLIGHNGAGKTTTLNALLGLTDFEGTISVLGLNPFKHRAQVMEDVAFISDVASLPRFLKVSELFDLVGDIHPKFSRHKAMQFLQGTDLKPGLKIKHLSKGMLAQLHIAVVMAIDAKLLVLDEPTLGLDITYRKTFYKRLLEDYMNEERTVLITTHQVDEIEFLLTDIMFIRDGELILDVPVDTIGDIYNQLIANGESVAKAKSLQPLFAERHLGRDVMIFENVDEEKLAPLGELSTPSLSDLFVALMQRQTNAQGEQL